MKTYTADEIVDQRDDALTRIEECEWKHGCSKAMDDARTLAKEFKYVAYSDVAPLVEALREIKMVTGNEYVDHLDGNHQAYKLASAALSTLDADGSKP